MSEPTQTKRTRADFAAIYNSDGTCHHRDCGLPGVVLVYDAFTPESASWCCVKHWNTCSTRELLTILEDKRPQRFANKSAMEIIGSLVTEYDLGERPYTGSFEKQDVQYFRDTTFFDAMRQMANYTWRETSPGVYEHVFTTPTGQEWTILPELTSGNRLTRKIIAQARQAIKARRVRKRRRRKHRAVYRRWKRGLT